MTDLWIGFFAGAMVWVPFGFFLAAVVVSGKKADELTKKERDHDA